MSIVKRADLGGKVVVSETLLECPRCGHGDVGKIRKCPSCGEEMIVKQSNVQK